MKYRFLKLFVLLSVTLLSCNKNAYVLSPDKLENVLVDLHLVEGVAMIKSSEYKKVKDKLNIYSFVYEKHNIDKAIFDSTMRYYAEYPVELVEIYDKVLARLDALEKEVDAGQYTITTYAMPPHVREQVFVEDIDLLPYTVNEFWRENRRLQLVGDAIDRGRSVSLDVDTLHHLPAKLNLRFKLTSDQISGAICEVKSVFSDKEAVKEFELSNDSVSVANLEWSCEAVPSQFVITLKGQHQEKSSALTLENIRLYEISAQKRDFHFFD